MKNLTRIYCPSCHYVIHGYDSRCPSCGAKVGSYYTEEALLISKKMKIYYTNLVRKQKLEKINKI